jgi:hypothetical protein
MAYLKTLIDGITATDATKRTFTLISQNYKSGSTPALRSTGMGVGDDINLHVWVAGAWEDLGSVLDDTVSTYALPTMGEYAVTATLTTAGPVSCELHCYDADAA